MKKTIMLITGLVFLFIGCAKPPPPPPPPPPEPEPIAAPELEPESEVDSAAILAQRVQELLNKILGNKIYFDFDRYVIKPEGKEILSEVGSILLNGNAGRRINVRIEGHTCDIGTSEYNMALGERRARSVMEYLESYGVQAGRVAVVSFGEEQPAAENADDASRNQNRRAEFKATASIQ